MKDHPRLPESELDIMLVIWDLGDQAAAPAILERLERPLTASALHSYLKRLEDKGYLTCTKEGKTNVYTPLVDEGEYLAFENAPFLEGRGLPGLVAALYDSRSVSREELAELRAFLDEAMGKEGDV